MGLEIDRSDFTTQDFIAFQAALERNLGSLLELLQTPGFGEGPRSLGAELEIYLVDQAGEPLHANQAIHSAAGDPQLTLELNRYNLEYNLTPQLIDAAAFTRTEADIVARLADLRQLAAGHGGHVLPIGILPTLRQADFGTDCVTDLPRYHALVKQLIERRGSDFCIDIDGADPLRLDMADITLEGANTSFQLHYRVAPAAFADTFNALQLATPLALALAANSPTLFGHSLWRETRIPLFKQSIDIRQRDRYSWSEPARVNFGRGWVRRGAFELFEEAVRLYHPLIPVCADDASAIDGEAPALRELRLHLSTVWLWNRPVYDPVDGGHLRIEMRALPAGPTAVDMVANAAFLIGLAEGLRGGINRLLPAIPFHIAEHNFYRAAQHGLQANLVWPRHDQHRLREQPVMEIIASLLPVARDGLASVGVTADEIDYYLGIIQARLEGGATAADWQLEAWRRLEKDMTSHRALHAMLRLFMTHSEANLPVAQWPLP
ncbi:MAG: glutamate--cysteine ligase [Chromatocurvus sp.]